MPIHEILLKISGKGKAAEGDIIAVRPHGFNWGLNEIKHFLILLVFDNRTTDELSKLCKRPLYIDGREIEEINEAQEACFDMGILFIEPEKAVDFRFKIDIEDLKILNPELNLTKVRENTIYQPYKKASKLIEKFNGKKGNHKLTVANVNAGWMVEQEIIIGGNDFKNLFKEKKL